MGEYGIIVGDNRETIKQIQDSSVDVIITSPSYYQLRKYSGDEAGVQLGNENTPEAYIANLVEIFGECWSKLKHNGTMWVNLADSFSGSGGAHAAKHANPGISKSSVRSGAKRSSSSVAAKNLLGIPYRVALALRDYGWYWRAIIPWVKASAMPQSALDRPTIATEYWLMFSKSKKYYYDQYATLTGDSQRFRRDTDWFNESLAIIQSTGRGMLLDEAGMPLAMHFNPGNKPWAYCEKCDTHYTSKQMRYIQNDECYVCHSKDGWVKHYAAFPVPMIEPIIRASTSEYGVCSGCGKPWIRNTKKVAVAVSDSPRYSGNLDRNDSGDKRVTRAIETIDWQPSCNCFTYANCDPDQDDHTVIPCPVIPATILDPFSGTASTGLAALALNRNYLGCELSEPYAKASLARMRALSQPSDNVLPGQLVLC